jgi:hypothetical protein
VGKRSTLGLVLFQSLHSVVTFRSIVLTSSPGFCFNRYYFFFVILRSIALTPTLGVIHPNSADQIFMLNELLTKITYLRKKKTFADQIYLLMNNSLSDYCVAIHVSQASIGWNSQIHRPLVDHWLAKRK